jgi:serine/threonine protein kinase
MMSVCGNTLGRLSLTTVLGRGGMGLVWNAHTSGSAQTFAVKMLAPDLAPAPAARARFEREAEILGRLDNDGVVKLRDRGETDDGIPFVVMDRIAGYSVDKVLHRKKMLTVRETVRILAPLLCTLAAVHRAGVSHRDIKPGNIMLNRSASGLHVTLIDFGVAGTQWDSPSLEAHVVGTIHYMSPEQAWNAGKPTAQADLWSVAVVAYECLTGRMPFDGPTLNDVFCALDRGGFAPVSHFRPDLPGEIDGFFARAFSQRSTDRFANAAAMHEALVALPWADAQVPEECLQACSTTRAHGTSHTHLSSPQALRPKESPKGSGWFKGIGLNRGKWSPAPPAGVSAPTAPLPSGGLVKNTPTVVVGKRAVKSPQSGLYKNNCAGGWCDRLDEAFDEPIATDSLAAAPQAAHLSLSDDTVDPHGETMGSPAGLHQMMARLLHLSAHASSILY